MQAPKNTPRLGRARNVSEGDNKRILDKEYNRQFKELSSLRLGGVSSEGPSHRIHITGTATYGWLFRDEYCFSGTVLVRKYDNGMVEYLSDDLRGFAKSCD